MLHTKDRDAVHSLRYFWSTRTRHQTSYFGKLWRGHCLQLAQKAQHVAKGETLAQHSPKAAQPAAAAAPATAAAEASQPTPTPTPTPPPLHPAPLSQAAGPPDGRGAVPEAAPGVPQSSLVQQGERGEIHRRGVVRYTGERGEIHSRGVARYTGGAW